MGAADVLETFSIYGRQSTSSAELSRILVKFPVASISTDRTNTVIPGSGSVSFYLRMFNAANSKTAPSGAFSYTVEPLSRDWQEGYGLDLEGYKDITKRFNRMVKDRRRLRQHSKRSLPISLV
jgi:hypothetical protein